MNDFTKDELIVLQQAFKGACKAFANDKFDSALEIKIQSMIDNYCEHDSPCSAQQILDFAKGMR